MEIHYGTKEAYKLRIDAELDLVQEKLASSRPREWLSEPKLELNTPSMWKSWNRSFTQRKPN